MEYYSTLGPSSADHGILIRMFKAGMTGVRLNLSHGDLSEDGVWFRILSEAAAECGVSPEILIDLRGPELRLGALKDTLEVRAGDFVEFGGENGLPIPDVLLEHIEEGVNLLADDGKLEFEVHKTASTSGRGTVSFLARALRGGRILSGKSLALVGKELPMPTLTESDRENIRQAARYGVTGVMLPFVRNKEDLLILRDALKEAEAEKQEKAADFAGFCGSNDTEKSRRLRIFAKIENMQGVARIDELLPYADQIVIARGDLGNAMPLWKLPGVQKELAYKCRAADKPFMVVTQMLDSMHERKVPTRAEVSDIYNAVMDGAASVMLTGETAVGKYPAEAMEYLVKTAEEARKDREKALWFQASCKSDSRLPERL